MQSLHFSPVFWRDRAAECRELAELLADAVAKASMLEVAEDYEKIARRYEGINLARLDENG